MRHTLRQTAALDCAPRSARGQRPFGDVLQTPVFGLPTPSRVFRFFQTNLPPPPSAAFRARHHYCSALCPPTAAPFIAIHRVRGHRPRSEPCHTEAEHGGSAPPPPHLPPARSERRGLSEVAVAPSGFAVDRAPHPMRSGSGHGLAACSGSEQAIAGRTHASPLPPQDHGFLPKPPPPPWAGPARQHTGPGMRSPPQSSAVAESTASRHARPRAALTAACL